MKKKIRIKIQVKSALRRDLKEISDSAETLGRLFQSPLPFSFQPGFWSTIEHTKDPFQMTESGVRYVVGSKAMVSFKSHQLKS